MREILLAAGIVFGGLVVVVMICVSLIKVTHSTQTQSNKFTKLIHVDYHHSNAIIEYEIKGKTVYMYHGGHGVTQIDLE